MDIICTKQSCKYNDNFRCNAKKICVDKKIQCETFCKGETNKQKIEAGSIFDKTPPKYSPHRESKVGAILCKTNCIFNDNGICEANGITVNNLENKPFCVTYLKK